MACIDANPTLPGATLRAAFGIFTMNLTEALERRRTLRQLRALDAETLRDIGMSRSEIISVVFGPGDERRRNHGFVR